MIPKIVYYCWFGGVKPQSIEMRINAWKQRLSDYTFVEINEQNFDYSQYQFTKDAYQAKKFAYVSDVARLVYLEQTGGIYLDTDVDVLQAFDSFLTDDMLHLSMEYYGYEITGVNVGTIICPKAHPVIQQVKERVLASTYFEHRPPINVYFNQAFPMLLYRNKEQIFTDEQTHIHQTEIFCKRSVKSVTIHQYDNSWGVKLTRFQKGKRLCGVLVKKVIGRKRFTQLFQKEVHNEGHDA